jgi:hypothetical protein
LLKIVQNLDCRATDGPISRVDIERNQDADCKRVLQQGLMLVFHLVSIRPTPYSLRTQLRSRQNPADKLETAGHYGPWLDYDGNTPIARVKSPERLVQ